MYFDAQQKFYLYKNRFNFYIPICNITNKSIITIGLKMQFMNEKLK